MKKVLFATTALIATAGVAAAEVTFSGYGRFGIVYSDADNGGADDYALHSRLQFDVNIATEADNGISFAATFRTRPTVNSIFAVSGNNGANAGVPDDNRPNTAATFNAPRFSLSASGLTVAVGNIYGAIDSAPGYYSGSVGLTGLSYTNTPTNRGIGTDAHSYSSGGAGSNNQGVEVIYDGGPFGVHVSHINPGQPTGAGVGNNPVAPFAGSDSSSTQIVLSYTWMDYTFVGGYQHGETTANNEIDWYLAAGGNIGPANVWLKIADNGADDMWYNLSGSFDVSAATSVQAYVTYDENDTAAPAWQDETSYGIGFVHSLGGGASLRGGVESAYDDVKADFGVRFNF